MKITLVSIIAILIIVGTVLYLEEETTGMGVRRVYLIGVNPEIEKMCARQINCKSGLLKATARAVDYDQESGLATCECPDGRTFRLSALTWTYAGVARE